MLDAKILESVNFVDRPDIIFLCFYDLVDYLGSKDFDVFHRLWLTIYPDNPAWERYDIHDEDEKKWFLRTWFRERCEDTLSVIKEDNDIMDITEFGLPQK